MENRKPETGNGKPGNVRGVGASVYQFALSISGFRFSIFVSLLFSLLVSSAAYATAPAPTPARAVPHGFGKAKFGMTLEQVRRLYPKLAPAPAITGAAYFPSPNLARYWITKVDVPGLRNRCNVEFHFWNNHLWNVIVHYRTNPFADVMKNLRRAYGPPTSEVRDPSWALGTATITTSPGQMWYGFDDAKITKDVQRALLEAVHQQVPKAPPTPTP
jgi:hypothetical protein